MITKSALLGGAGLAAMAALLMVTGAEAKPAKHHKHAGRAEPSATQSQVSELEAQVQALQAWRSQEAQAHDADEAQLSSMRQQLADTQARAEAAENVAREQIQTLPGEVRTAVAAAQPHDDKIHYKGVTITLNGFAAAESVYRTKNEIADIGSNYSKIPFGNNVVGNGDETRLTARQSRIGFLAQGKPNTDTTLSFYGEFDFLGAGQTANSNESNSYNLRIRHIYGSVDWADTGVSLLAGQTWSLVTMNAKGITPRNEVIPATIDAQYVPGFVWARQTQVRLTKNFDNTLWIAVSAENPQTTFASGGTFSNVVPTIQGAGTIITGASGNINGSAGSASSSLLNSLVPYSLNRYPDFVGKVAFEPDFGGGNRPLHLEAFGVWSDYYDNIKVSSAANGLTPGAYKSEKTGGGVGAGATFAAVPKMLDLQASFMTGSGIGRYGSGQLPDATLSPDGKIQPINETLWLVGGTVHATPNLDVYAYYGDETESARAYNPKAGGHYGYGNSYFVNTGCVSELASGTCTANVKDISQIAVGAWDKVYNGSFGSLRIGVQYSHTNLTAFGGVLGSSGPGAYSPKTSDDMVFTSFRYYPF